MKSTLIVSIVAAALAFVVAFLIRRTDKPGTSPSTAGALTTVARVRASNHPKLSDLLELAKGVTEADGARLASVFPPGSLNNAANAYILAQRIMDDANARQLLSALGRRGDDALLLGFLMPEQARLVLDMVGNRGTRARGEALFDLFRKVPGELLEEAEQAVANLRGEAFRDSLSGLLCSEAFDTSDKLRARLEEMTPLERNALVRTSSRRLGDHAFAALAGIEEVEPRLLPLSLRCAVLEERVARHPAIVFDATKRADTDMLASIVSGVKQSDNAAEIRDIAGDLDDWNPQDAGEAALEVKSAVVESLVRLAYEDSGSLDPKVAERALELATAMPEGAAKQKLLDTLRSRYGIAPDE